MERGERGKKVIGERKTGNGQKVSGERRTKKKLGGSGRGE